MQNICENPDTLNTIMVIKDVIIALFYIIPAVVIIVITISILKMVVFNQESTFVIELKKNMRRLVIMVLALIFPSIFNMIATNLPNSVEAKTCYLNANSEYIDNLRIDYARESIKKAKEENDIIELNKAKEQIKKIRNEEIKKELEEEVKLIEEEIRKNIEAEDAVRKAEQTLEEKDYEEAKKKVNELSDKKKISEYEKRLDVVKKKIDEKNTVVNDYGKGQWVYYPKGKTVFPYALYVPEDIGDASVPLIVWLHGAGERGTSGSNLIGSGFFKMITNWQETGLKNIPAIIAAPHLPKEPKGNRWHFGGNPNAVEEIMLKIMNEYSINRNKVILAGFSIGGSGVITVSGLKQQYFSCLLILSGYHSRVKPYEAYYRRMPIKGFSDPENKEYMESFMRKSGHSADVRHLNCGHGAVPRIVFTEDKDKNGVSDIVEWMLSQTKN